MSDFPIECPSCGTQFELNAVLTDRIRRSMKGEVNSEMLDREARLQGELEKLKASSDALEEARHSLADKISEGVKLEEKKWLDKTEQKMEAAFGVQLKEMQEALASREVAIKGFREQELALRKQKREVEESRSALELELTRKLDAERASIKEEVLKQAAEGHKLKDLEKERQIRELRADLVNVTRKAEQGSMENQGEVMEDLLQTRLPRLFPHDELRPVPKGIKGADVIQVVKTPVGEECGMMLWEAKNTKAWSGRWIPKLKEDLIEVRGHIAILVSRVLPEGVERFGVVDHVWVTDEASAYGLATALREQLLAVMRERGVLEGQQDKMAVLYRYLMGTEFKQKIEAIVEAFSSMEQQIQQERRAMEKQWKAREKMIERVMKNTVGMHGDIQGIAGGQLPSIPALELDGREGDTPLFE